MHACMHTHTCAYTQAHTVLYKNHNPQVQSSSNISRNIVGFHAHDTVYNRTHTFTQSLSLSLFTTLSEAGVKGPRPLQIEAVCDWLQAQVNHLVEAELAAVNGCSFWFQGDEELLRTVGRHQTSLEEEREAETDFHYRADLRG